MKKILLLSVIILIGNAVSAKKHKSEKNITTKQLSYDEYIQQYGTDDTSKAIIELYFDKRENCGAGQMSFLPVTAAVAVVVPPLGIGLMTISSPLFVNGVVTMNRYSHKNMVKALNNYHTNKTMSRSIKKKVINLMIAEEEIRNEEMAEKRLASLKTIK